MLKLSVAHKNTFKNNFTIQIDPYKFLTDYILFPYKYGNYS